MNSKYLDGLIAIPLLAGGVEVPFARTGESVSAFLGRKAGKRVKAKIRAKPEPIPESAIQAAICGLLGWLGVPFSVTDASRAFGPDGRPRRSKVATGWPDISLVLPDGRAAFFEVKRAKGKVSAEQAATISKLLNSGAFVAVAHSLDEAVFALNVWLPDSCDARDRLLKLKFQQTKD